MTASGRWQSTLVFGALLGVMFVLVPTFPPERRALGQSDEAHPSQNEGEALTLAEAGRYAEALKIAKQHLESSRANHGPEHPPALAAANVVGLVQLAHGDAADARAAFEAVLQGYRKHYGDRHVLTAEALNNLGAAMFHEGRWPQACETFQRAYELRKTLLGREHVDTLQSLANLAIALRQSGQDVPAEFELWVQEQLLPEQDDSGGRAFEEAQQGGVEDWDRHGHEPGVSLRAFWKKTDARSIGPGATSVDVFQAWENAIPCPQLIITVVAPVPRMLQVPDDLRTLTAARVMERVGHLLPPDEAAWFVPWRPIAEIRAEAYGAEHLQTVLAKHAAAAQEIAYGMGSALGHGPMPDGLSEEELLAFSPLLRVERMLAAIEGLVGRHHRITATLHRNLGIALSETVERREESRRHLEAGMNIVADRFGGVHPWTAEAAETLGLASFYGEDYSEAAVQLERATAIRRQVFGRDHLLVAQSLNSLGIARFKLAELEAACEAIEHALDMRAKAWGPSDRRALRSRSDLAVVRRTQGDYATSVRSLERALDLLTEKERELAEDPARPRIELGDLAAYRQVVENNLACVRLEMGDFAAARRHFETMLHAEPPPWLAGGILLNLGTIARLEGRLAEARKLFEQASKHDPASELALHNLGAVARDTGDFATAAECLGKVLAARRQRWGDDHPEVAFSQVALALLDRRRSDYEAADRKLDAALSVYTDHYGAANPKTTDLLRIRGENALLAERPDEAVGYLQQSLANKLRLADDLLPVLSEAEAMAHVLAFRERDLLLAALAGRGSPEEAYEVVWKTQGLATRAIGARQRVPREGEAKQVAAALRSVRAGLAARILDQYLPDLGPPAPKHSDLLELQRRKERLERKLADLSPADRRRQEANRMDSRDFLERLPDDVAVVDLVRVDKAEAPSGADAESNRAAYHAFVLLPGQPEGPGRVAWLDLGDAQPIDTAVSAWQGQILRREGGVPRGLAWEEQPLPQHDTPNVVLRRTVWDRIEPHLAGRKTVLVIPDGALAQVAWAALPGKQPGTYLLEEGYAFGTAVHRQLLDVLVEEAAPGTRHLLVGDVDYGESSGITEESRVGSNRTVPGATGLHWPPLPASGTEVRAIEQLIARGHPKVVLTGAAANKQAVMGALPASRFVLLATHGFFAPAEYASALAAPGRNAADPQMLDTMRAAIADSPHAPKPAVLTSVVGRNPLALSGIVLAGANRRRREDVFGVPRGNPGILTAEEIAGLRLDAVELVVLSACVSGRGEMVGGEGVFGLQRAFALAGARTVVGSLWHRVFHVENLQQLRDGGDLVGFLVCRDLGLRPSGTGGSDQCGQVVASCRFAAGKRNDASHDIGSTPYKRLAYGPGRLVTIPPVPRDASLRFLRWRGWRPARPFPGLARTHLVAVRIPLPACGSRAPYESARGFFVFPPEGVPPYFGRHLGPLSAVAPRTFGVLV